MFSKNIQLRNVLEEVYLWKTKIKLEDYSKKENWKSPNDAEHLISKK